jgi:hypothetical protein
MKSGKFCNTKASTDDTASASSPTENYMPVDGKVHTVRLHCVDNAPDRRIKNTAAAAVLTQVGRRHVRQLAADVGVQFGANSRRSERKTELVPSHFTLLMNFFRYRFEIDERHTIFLLAADQSQLKVFGVLTLSLLPAKSQMRKQLTSLAQLLTMLTIKKDA